MSRFREQVTKMRDESPERMIGHDSDAIAHADNILSRIPPQYKQRGFSNLSEVSISHLDADLVAGSKNLTIFGSKHSM